MEIKKVNLIRKLSATTDIPFPSRVFSTNEMRMSFPWLRLMKQAKVRKMKSMAGKKSQIDFNKVDRNLANVLNQCCTGKGLLGCSITLILRLGETVFQGTVSLTATNTTNW